MPRSRIHFSNDIDNSVLAHEVKSILLAPLIYYGKPVGVLQLVNRKPGIDI